MVAGHHQLQPVRFEEKKNNPDAAENPQLRSVFAQVAQTKAGVGMRLSKSGDKLGEAMAYFLQFRIAAMFGPAFPAWPDFNREGLWGFRPIVWFFHAWLVW